MNDPAPSPVQPVQETERIQSLDVLRGFAIFGIFIVNIAFFALPLYNGTDPASLADGAAPDRIGWAIAKALFEYKFVSLFSLMFGIGMVVQFTRAAQRNAPFFGLYVRRLAVLLLIGLIHALALWYGDILFIYSLVGFLMLALIQLSGRTLMVIGCLAVALSITMAVGLLALSIAMTPPEMIESKTKALQQVPPVDTITDAPVGSFERFSDVLSETNWQLGPAGWVQAETIAYSDGPYLAALVMRGISFLGMLIFATLGGFGLRVVGMFCIGAALMKLGFFQPTWRRMHRALTFVVLPIGLLGEGLCVYIYFNSDFATAWSMVGAEFVHAVASFLLCFGYAGLIVTLVDLGLVRWVTRALANVGRMALTNYLAQTIIATGIMYSWGLGMFGSFNRLQLLGMVIPIFIVQVVASILWLRFFRFGPFEWLWRSLTYWKLQPLRRAAAPA